VTIIVNVIAALLLSLPLPPLARSVSTIIAITAFVMLVGAPASAVRAGIMGGLVVFARATGRLSDGFHALLLSGAAMVFLQPGIISDIGFQLSVGATAGLIAFSGSLEQRLRFVPSLFGMRSSLASTLAATTMTQPIILLYFGQASLIAPFVNLLVLPLIPITMLLGLVVCIIGGILPVFAPFVAWISWVPLAAVLNIVAAGASLPFAAYRIGQTGAVALAAIWASMVAYIFMRRKRHVAS
jgi:competence protein ComEC